MDLTTIHTSDGRKCYMSLLGAWGLVADVDIESEKMRKIGDIRFFLGELLYAECIAWTWTSENYHSVTDCTRKVCDLCLTYSDELISNDPLPNMSITCNNYPIECLQFSALANPASSLPSHIAICLH